MAKTCFKCHIDLTMQDSFDWKGNRVCRNCLDVLKAEEERSKPITKSKAKKKKPEMTVASMKKDIRGWGIGLIILGFIHLLAAGFLEPTWGVVIIILGIINLVLQRREMYIANGIALIVVGIMNIAGSIDAGGGSWTAFGIMQLIWGGQEIRKFFKFKNLHETGEELAGEAKESLPKDLSTIKDYKLLFDKKKFGINYYLGVGLLLWYIISGFVWQALFALLKGYTIYFGFNIYDLILNVLSAFGFIFIHHYFFKNIKSVALIYAVYSAIISFLFTYINYLNISKIDPKFIFHFEYIFTSFIWGLVLVYGLAKIINNYGLNWKSLAIGLIIINLIQYIGSLIVFLIVRGAISIDLLAILYRIIVGVGSSVIFYYGFVLHLQNKKRSEFKTKMEESSSISPEQTLEKLKSMLDKGMITLEEYKTKRTEVLNRI